MMIICFPIAGDGDGESGDGPYNLLDVWGWDCTAFPCQDLPQGLPGYCAHWQCETDRHCGSCARQGESNYWAAIGLVWLLLHLVILNAFSLYILFLWYITVLQEELRTGEKAVVLFKFIKHPEYLKVGAKVLFREGVTKGIGHVTKLQPIAQYLPSQSEDDEA